jgi:hypothetical protein
MNNTLENGFSACAGFMMCVCALGLIGGGVCFYVFGIIFLVEDYDEAKECKQSDLWVMVLIIIILGVLNGRATQKNVENDNDNESNICSAMCMFTINLAFAIWSGIELYDKAYNPNCQDLRNSNLYTFAFAIFIIYIIINSILLIVISMFLFSRIGCCKEITTYNFHNKCSKLNEQHTTIKINNNATNNDAMNNECITAKVILNSSIPVSSDSVIAQPIYDDENIENI